jgi:acetamidase/formamidase
MRSSRSTSWRRGWRTRWSASFLAALALWALPVSAEHHILKPTPKTVVWGYYDASVPPALRVRPGDTVEMDSVMIPSPAMLEAGGVKPEEIAEQDRRIHREVKQRGPGPHPLTGPVYVEGAEPGDTLEVRIEKIDLLAPYAFCMFIPGMGFLPEDFPYEKTKIVRLDRERMVGRFAPGVDVPLRPFFGSMGVAPPPLAGQANSAPPWIHAGNMDNRELSAGSVLYVPVHARGALFSIGDGHAAQGDGEVTLTALETALRGVFRFEVRKGRRLLWPRAETPTHYLMMGFHEDLKQAAQAATREMIDFLAHEKGLGRDEAYLLTSVAADLRITQVVDGKSGVHAMIAKSVLAGKR